MFNDLINLINTNFYLFDSGIVGLVNIVVYAKIHNDQQRYY